MSHHPPRSVSRRAFSLIELLLSIGVLAMLMAILMGMVNAVVQHTTASSARTEAFEASRNAFEAITRRISQATLNTYWDYDDPDAPARYLRRSELRFVSGASSTLIGTERPASVTHAAFFQAPLGQVDDPSLIPLNSLLNTWGYYVEKNSDESFLPPLNGLRARERYRLMEMREPSEKLAVFELTSGNPENPSHDWFKIPLQEPGYQRIVAENVIALIILPKLSERDDPGGFALPGDAFVYDSAQQGQGSGLFSSKNQLPPLVQVTLVAIDEASALRLESGSADLDLDGLFLRAHPLDFKRDLEALEDQLNAQRLTYRVFSTEVQILASKWSVE